MAHVFILVEARETWMNIFIGDLLKRRYPYILQNGQQAFIQPNPREVKLFDITLPEECIPYLMRDIGNKKPNSDSKKKAAALAKLFRKFGGLKELEGVEDPSEDVRRQWVNVIPLGWRKDPVDVSGRLEGLPKGGELV